MTHSPPSPRWCRARAGNLSLLLGTVLGLLGGCSEESAAPPPPPTITGLPARFTLPQRSTMDLPGSGGRIRISIGDVTRSQVLVTVTTKTGTELVAATSMREGATACFRFEGHLYELRQEALRNALLGRDEAGFLLALTAPLARSEAEKIEALLATMATMNDAVFLRNGAEHPAAEAADHLRTKWRSADRKDATARDFIDGVATHSSLSGEPYRVRYLDGHTRELAELLSERLLELEAAAR